MRRLSAVSRASLLAVSALLVGSLLGVGAAPASAYAEEGAEEYSAAVEPEIASAAALLIEPTTGTTLLNKDADARREPASTTKVMTALVVIENASLDQQVSVEEGDFAEVTADSSVAGLIAGETLTVRDLLACLLLPSGNDASYVLARAVGGDWQTFVGMMNDRAAELGCTGTHFANPCGLHDDDHYTTARDLATIFLAALEHPEFVEIAGAATWDLPETSQNPARTLENTNLLIDPESPVYMDGAVIAGKTGTTGDAGRCLVVGAEKDDMSLVGVVLGADFETADELGIGDNFYDMQAMLEWGFGAWRTGEVVAKGDVVATADVSLSTDGETLDAESTDAIVATVPRETTLEDLTFAPTWEGLEEESGTFQAPIELDQALGEATVSLGDRRLGSVGLAASRAMELSIPAFVLWWLSDPIHAAIVAACVVALFVVIGLVAASSRRRRSRYKMAVGKKATGSHAAPLRASGSTRGGGRHARK